MKKRLDSLRIERFRQIRELSIPDLGHVNLVVGGNNSGKSTVLDALRFYAAKAAPSLIAGLLRERGEWDTESDWEDWELGIRNLFFGRRFPEADGESLYVGDIAGERRMSMEYVLQVPLDAEELAQDGRTVAIRRMTRIPRAEGVHSGGGFDSIEFRSSDIPDAWVVRVGDLFDTQGRGASYERRIAGVRIPYQYVSPGTVDYQRLSDGWDGVVLTPLQAAALQALQIIEPQAEDLAFVHEAQVRRAMLKLKGADRPVSLQSMGDGMARALQLILAALQAKDGFLLIDEFENGLHHSVQARVWEMLFNLAQTRSLQIFATTHSNDCVRAFSQVALANRAVDGNLLKLERMPEDGRTVVATLGEDELSNLLDAGIEVRG